VGFYEGSGREGILDLMIYDVFQMLLHLFTISIILIIVPRYWAITTDSNSLKVTYSAIILLFSCFPENK
jgi:hypothetical protein